MADSPRARTLAADLRAARKVKGMSQELLAEQLGWSNAKISRMETAKTTITEPDVAAILAVLRIRGEDRRHMLKMARELDQPAWWELHHGLPGQMRALIDAEQRASRITNVAISYVPGLLQTRAYSRGIFANGDRTEDQIEDAVAIRQSRQGILDKATPAELVTFLDEAVLLRPVGGPRTTADQIRYAIKISEQPNITLRVLPLHAGAHKGLDGPFTLLEFSRGKPNVNIEASNAGIMLDDGDDVAPFQRTIASLTNMALSADESIELMVAHAAKMEDCAP